MGSWGLSRVIIFAHLIQLMTPQGTILQTTVTKSCDDAMQRNSAFLPKVQAKLESSTAAES